MRCLRSLATNASVRAYFSLRNGQSNRCTLVSMMSGGESALLSGSSPWAARLGSAPRAAGSSTPFRNLRLVNFLMIGIHWESLRFGQGLNDCNTGRPVGPAARPPMRASHPHRFRIDVSSGMAIMLAKAGQLAPNHRRKEPPLERLAKGQAMRVFVTGASGYIGGSIAQKLCDSGHQIVGLARSEKKAGLLKERGITPILGTLDESRLLTDATR